MGVDHPRKQQGARKARFRGGQSSARSRLVRRASIGILRPEHVGSSKVVRRSRLRLIPSDETGRRFGKKPEQPPGEYSGDARKRSKAFGATGGRPAPASAQTIRNGRPLRGGRGSDRACRIPTQRLHVSMGCTLVPVKARPPPRSTCIYKLMDTPYPDA
jgi:hypothetical protein